MIEEINSQIYVEESNNPLSIMNTAKRKKQQGYRRF